MLTIKKMKLQLSSLFQKKGLSAVIVATGVILLGTGLFWLFSKENASSQNKSDLLSMPHFVLEDDHHQKRNSDEFNGQVLIVHFWASWCEPCVTEIPLLLQFVKSLQGRPVKVLAISLDENWEDAFRVLPKQSVPTNMISLIDPSLSVAKNFGSFEYPESYLMDRKGRIFRKWIGPQPWGDVRFREAVELLL